MPARAAQNAAKKFDEIRSDDAYRTFKLKLNPVLERGDFESKEEEDAFVDYYTRFSLPHWTQQKFYSEQKSLPALRKEMHDNLVMSDRHTPKRVHDRLNELVLEFLGDVANNRNPLDNSAADFAPASRINAMLMIGELNAVERSGSTAIPYPDSLPFLLKTINNDLKQEAAARQVEVAIKVAAAVGVNYQVTLGIEDAQRPQVLATMLKVLRAPDPTGGQGDGWSWLQAQAADILGRLGAAGDDGAIASALATLAADPKASLRARGGAARAMKSLKYNGPKNPAPGQPPWASWPWTSSARKTARWAWRK